MAPSLVRFLCHRLNHPALLYARPQPCRHRTSHILLVVLFTIILRLGVFRNLNRPIRLLPRLLHPVLALSQAVQYPPQRLIRHTPLRSHSAATQHGQFWDCISRCLRRISMMVQTPVTGYAARDARCEELAGEVEAELGGVESVVGGVVWRGGIGRVDGRHPGERGGVVREGGEVFGVQVLEEVGV